jgi:hypothetical protein
MRLQLGHLEYGIYLEYTIWLVENNLIEALQVNTDYKTYAVDFKELQDAVAFKLKFGV